MLNKPPKTATSGERSFYNRVQEIFTEKDSMIGYFEPDIGGLRPDYLLLSPLFGVLVVEIKDYSPNELINITKSGNWDKLKDNKAVSINNPFDQIYQYWRAIQDRVNLSHFPDDIEIPIIRIVVFSLISGEEDAAEKIRQIVPYKIQLCFKETLGRNQKFKDLLNDVLPINYSLEKKYFEVLRANIIPTCRLPIREQSDLMKFFTPEDQIKLLDREQEHLARKLGEGHRLIFGVAGSGKTVSLIARARFLAQKYPDWKILILCYNKLLKEAIFHLLNPQDYDADITISTFHAWSRQYILSYNNEFSRLYNEGENNAERDVKMDAFFHDFVPNIFLQMLNSLGDKKVLYDAILIDEAQDFEADWFRVIVQLLNPDSNSLLITCDGLQGIYARKRFHWSDVGIQARGRVIKYAKSYRTPIEIGVLSQKSLPNTLRYLLDKYDEFISTKEYGGNHGIVEIMVSNTRVEEYEKLVEKILRLTKQPQMIFVLFKYKIEKIKHNHPFFENLAKLNIEWKDLKSYSNGTTGIFVGTIYSSKGLECDTIIIPEVNTYGTNNQRQLLYVGMTRSLKKLILSAHKRTLLIQDFESCQNLNSNFANGT